MQPDLISEQKDAVDKILVPHTKRLIVAGPGTGKTTVFKLLLKKLPPGSPSNRLALTFIIALKEDLQADLVGLAEVLTFHAYCYQLLRTDPTLRSPLSTNFD